MRCDLGSNRADNGPRTRDPHRAVGTRTVSGQPLLFGLEGAMEPSIRRGAARLLLLAVGFICLAGPLMAPDGAAAGVPSQADLGLAKSVNDATPNVGENVTFTVVLTNNGPDTATHVSVHDQLPAGLTFVSATPSQGTYNSGTGTWTVGTVATSTPQVLQIQATVTSPSALTNSATIAGADQSDVNPGNNTANATVTPQQADLSLTKIVSDPTPNVGDNITFTLTVGNSGPDTATGVSVQDSLPAGLTFVSAAPSQGTYNPTTGTWAVGTVTVLDPPPTLALTATVTSPNAQTNSASVSGDQFDPDPGNNSASAAETPQQADLGLTKVVSNPTPNVGDNITFTMTVGNSGPDTATNVTVNDQLPAGLTFVSSSPSQGTYNSGTGIWTVGTVTTSAPQTLQIQATVTSSDARTNIATASGDQFDPDTSNNTASATETPQQADLGLTKVVSDATPEAGENVTFTVTLASNGPDTATNVSVHDQLPAGLSFVSAVPSQGTYSPGTGTWAVGTVT